MEVETDYDGRVEGWKPIQKKPEPYFISIGPKCCSLCGKLYFDTWTKFCGLDGEWLLHTEVLDMEHRKLLGMNEPSQYQKLQARTRSK